MIARCLIATTLTWSSTTVIPALLVQSGAAVTSFSPGPLGLSGDVSERLICSREPVLAAHQLRDLLRRRRFDWVIVADEMLLLALIEGVDPAAPPDWLPIDPTDRDAVGLALSKHTFAERAAEIDIRVPEFGFATSMADALRRAREFGFPVVLKGDRGFAGSEVRVCRDTGSLARAIDELIARSGRVLVQRHIVGSPASACVLYDRGAVVAYKAYRAECSYPDVHAASTVHTFFEHPDIEATARALGRATEFHGMAGIDFITDGDRLFALEINPRPTIGFAGTVANRAFFSPSIRRFLACEPALGTIAYDGREAMQTYFPGYLCYFLKNLAKRDALAFDRLAASLREARSRDAILAAWGISRFAYDEIANRLPGVRTAVARARGSTGTARALPTDGRVSVAP